LAETPLEGLLRRIEDRTARIGVIGMGYVGLPLAVAFAREFGVIGFDTNRSKIDKIARGESYLIDVPSTQLWAHVENKSLEATADFSLLAQCDAILMCVPTPLAKSKDPDLSNVEGAAYAVASRLRPGQIVVLESTSYPGTTDEVLLPLFLRNGLELDRDFFLAFSP